MIDIDKRITSYHKISIYLKFLIWILNYNFERLFINTNSIIGFISPNAVLENKSLITIGRRCKIEGNVYISALSEYGIKIGDNFTIKRNSIINCTGVYKELGLGITIGNNVGISENCIIYARGLIKISDDVIIGPSTIIVSENHIFEDTTKPIKIQGTSRVGINIESGAWIGANAKILDGVTIGKNSVIAAGSVVTRSVPAGAVYAGIPAKDISTSKKRIKK